jgi:hypothetical protein
MENLTMKKLEPKWYDFVPLVGVEYPFRLFKTIDHMKNRGMITPKESEDLSARASPIMIYQFYINLITFFGGMAILHKTVGLEKILSKLF